jgi:hypothetical protein
LAPGLRFVMLFSACAICALMLTDAAAIANTTALPAARLDACALLVARRRARRAGDGSVWRRLRSAGKSKRYLDVFETPSSAPATCGAAVLQPAPEEHCP